MAWADVPGSNSIWEYENTATAANTYANAPGSYSGGIRTFTSADGMSLKIMLDVEKKVQLLNVVNYQKIFMTLHT